jgi:ATPase subunit of ABC transporter with duplicated ATPase domains
MSHIHLAGVTVGTLDKPPIFPPLTQVISNEVVGLFGRNGCGKSSLLNAIAGRRALLTGSITVVGSIGLMHQSAFAPDANIAEALGVKNGLQRLDRIEAGEALEADFEEADWDLPLRLERVMREFDLSEFPLDQSSARLSGGEQARVKLAALVLAQPDILLLDEPTNDLDDAGRAMVADLLKRWEGPALVASHDRTLLEDMDRIIELSPAGALSVGGGWSAFKEQRDAVRAQAQAAFDEAKANQRKALALERARSDRQARRNKQGKMASARRDDSRLEINVKKSQAERTSARAAALGQEQVAQASENVKAADALVERVVPIRIELPRSGLLPGHRLIEAREISLAISGRQLFGPLDLVITGPERLAVTGPNGSGKSSLVRLLTGEAPPDHGVVEGDFSRVCVLDQHLSMLREDESTLAAMKRHNPELDNHGAHAALAGFGFRGDWSERTVGTLSGGERVRLALDCLFSAPLPPQLLILDEPTNHLDIYAIELLEQALLDFDGAILCISHDSAFRDALGLTRSVDLS